MVVSRCIMVFRRCILVARHRITLVQTIFAPGCARRAGRLRASSKGDAKALEDPTRHQISVVCSCIIIIIIIVVIARTNVITTHRTATAHTQRNTGSTW
eukprot:3631164-Rhodomonas_salina.2